MSDTGCNYRNVLVCNSELNVNQSIVKWKMKQANLHNTINTLYELIDIRDGAQECIGFTHNEILTFITMYKLAQCTFPFIYSYMYYTCLKLM